MEDKNANKKKGPAYIQPEHIKPKSKWTKKTTVWTIIIAVVVLGILAIIGANNGWFKTKDMINGKIIVGDYSSIDVQESDIQVTDAMVDSFMNSIVSYGTTSEEATEGTVETGDTIKLDYTGVLTGEEEPFEGGSAQNTSLKLGSGTMIPGFEDQIAGHDVGETFDINVTFPEDYQSEDLAGKDATFTITINSKTVTNVPELTDELVQKYSSEQMDQEFNTVDEVKEYYKDNTYNNNLNDAIMRTLVDRSEVKYFNEANLASVSNYFENSLNYYASMFGTDTKTMAGMYGFDSPKDYGESTAKNALTQTMILDTIAQEQGIECTDEDFNEVISKHMEQENFTGTMEEFLANADPGALYIIKETEALQPKVMDYLKANVNIIPAPQEETEAASDEDAQVPAEEESEAPAEEESEAPAGEPAETEAAAQEKEAETTSSEEESK